MMSRRYELNDIFKDLLGNNNVYFQPPESIKLSYPCIIYQLSDIDTRRADDLLYLKKPRYTVTLIDKNPDTEFVDQILELPYCSFDRMFASDNLNHFVFTLYF